MIADPQPWVNVNKILSLDLQEVHVVPAGELLPHGGGYLVIVPVNLVPHQHPQHLRYTNQRLIIISIMKVTIVAVKTFWLEFTVNKKETKSKIQFVHLIKVFYKNFFIDPDKKGLNLNFKINVKSFKSKSKRW